MSVLITGVAGFIGYHVANRLLKQNRKIIGIDNLNEYYNIELKKQRLCSLGLPRNICKAGSNVQNEEGGLIFHYCDISDKDVVMELCKEHDITLILHFAAQAGVRYSIEHPQTYLDSNVTGFLNIIEAARENNIHSIIYASSSSVYGATEIIPFQESDNADRPLSIYAATKRMNELMAYAYHTLYKIQMIGLRFFTVYGPFGRPDMAYYKFASDISNAREILLHDNGEMKRDFTYIDDVVDVILAMEHHCNLKQFDEHRIFNVGNSNPERVRNLIELLELNLGNPAVCKSIPIQPGEVRDTYSDNTLLRNFIGFEPSTPLEEGIRHFCEWYISRGVALESNAYQTESTGLSQSNE